PKEGEASRKVLIGVRRLRRQVWAIQVNIDRRRCLRISSSIFYQSVYTLANTASRTESGERLFRSALERFQSGQIGEDSVTHVQAIAEFRLELLDRKLNGKRSVQRDRLAHCRRR